MSGTVTATGAVQLPDWVNQAAMTNYQTAMGLSQQPYTAYPGQEIAPFSPLENQAFSTVQNMPSTAPTFQGALSSVQNLPQTTQSLLNPYLGSVEADTVSNINRSAAQQGQQIAAQAAQGGAYGGTRYGVEQATLDSETQRNIGQAVDTIQSQGYNTAMQTALQQAQTEGGLATQGQQAGLQLAGAQAQVGGAQQQQQQATLAQQLANWQQQQNWPYQQLAVAQSALAGSPYGTTATSSQPYTSNTLANALSTGAAAIPPVSGLVSQASGLFGSAGTADTGSFTTPDSFSVPGYTAPTSASDISTPSGMWDTGTTAAASSIPSVTGSTIPAVSDAASTGSALGKGG